MSHCDTWIPKARRKKEKEAKIRVALAGNPNVGKSVIFNELTGGRAWVGNWPGKTVEKKVGVSEVDGLELEIVDLPGTYSLTAYSIDELIARNYIVDEKPDTVVNVVNATALERNLYLTIQLLELGSNLIVALNMMDLAEKEGIKINVRKMSQILGVPVIPTVAIKHVGLDELKETIVKIAGKKPKTRKIVDYGKTVEREIEKLSRMARELGLGEKYDCRWLAIKLLEKDSEIEQKLLLINNGCRLVEAAKSSRIMLARELGMDIEEYMVEKRYLRIKEIIEACIEKGASPEVSLSDLVDYAVTHRVFGIPVMLTILYMLFQFAFTVAIPLMDLMDLLFNTYLYDLITGSQLPSLLKSFLADGIVAGIGSILVFLPNIVLLFLALSFLEDVGYMARAAFVIDRLMHKLGLTGKSIIPLIIGFGCNVPAVMATRPIEDEDDRKVTALVVPLMSCSARLPVYLLFAGAFFPAYQGFIVTSMYLLGLFLAIGVALIFRKLVFRGPTSAFIMELPPYMIPLAKNIKLKTWERTKRFLFKAGTVILVGMLLVWLLSVTGPQGFLGSKALEDATLLEKSWVGILGHLFEGVFKPLGWDWRAAVALLFGFIAKEIVVGTTAILYGATEENLKTVLNSVFTPLTAYAYMAFVLTYVPCLATLAAIKSELGWKYMLLALVYELALAYFLALGIIFIGKFIGFR
ncbi:MAG: ferrous iron transport protein B [Thermoprotei archaeon]|mgnify:CR=1 FL=1|nr:MAG: ferrous iron transport protein B [Thermoprotei archaeon]